MEFLGWDIGGVHLKLSRLVVDNGGAARMATSIVPFEIWKEPAGLPDRLRAMRDAAGRMIAGQAVTMTAELSDVYPDRAAGVRAILTACRTVLGPHSFRVLDRRGDLLAQDDAMERPQAVAAANWMATARLAARRAGTAVLIDTGSTTTDIIPIVDSSPRPLETTDTGRLMSGELVYSGVLRTPPSSYVTRVPLLDGWCRVAPEHFAISADVHRLLGRIDEDSYTVPTPDGRGKGRAAAAVRLARLVCAEPADLGDEAIDLLARFLADRQAEGIAAAIRQVIERFPAPAPRLEAIVAGAGAFLAATAAGRAGLAARALRDLFPRVEGGTWDAAAPSGALALLIAEQAGAIDLGARA